MNMNIPKGTKIIVELDTGEKLIGQAVEPGPTAPLFIRSLKTGIFLKRESQISYLSYETIKSIKVAPAGEKGVDL